MKRLFRIEGGAFDLQDLAELFSTGTRTVTKQDEHYYLTLDMQDGLDDEAALAIAEDELATINGLANVLIKNYQHRISGVSKLDLTTGKIITTSYAKGETKIRVRAHAEVAVMNPDGTPVPPSAPKDAPGHTILDLAATNEHLARALFLCGKVDHNWRGLYMVLEAIEDGNGGETALIKKSWGGERVKDFKKTCNSYKALGPDARHGSTKQGVEAPKVTLSEARELMRDLLSGWIAELRSKKT